MSLNQSRSEKSESTQLRKSGRSSNYTNQQRTFSSKSSGSGGGTAHPPASLSSSRRKPNNVQGGHSRVGVSTVNSESSNANAASHGVQNGAHVLPPLHGPSDGPVPGVATKPNELPSTQKSNRAVPKAPSSQSSTVSSDTTAPTTPAKGDASRAFSFQFGSISPGFMNGMQIPARTSSAPPNLDEQKRDQARLDSFTSVPTLPIPSVPKQQLTRKDAGAVDQSYAAEPHPMPKARKDAQVSSSPASSQTQKPSVLPMTGISMQMPFHHAQVPLQFGGPNPQIQSQGMTPTSLQMPLPMSLAMGNASQVQQQVFVQGLQPHLMQPQGIMHQGQSLSFTTQMGPQMPPQLGNLGVPQFPQQQVGKFVGAPRKTVKITHPETHKEVRLDERADTYFDGGSLGPRSHSNVPPQSQPIPSFTPAHPMNYYPNSYNAGSLFFPAPSSLPLTSTQITPSSQAPRFNYPVSQGPQSVTIMNPSTLSSLSVNKTGTTIPGTAEPQNLEHARDVHNVISSVPSATVHVSVKPAAGSIGDKVADSSLSISSPAVGKGESPKLSRPPMGASSFHPQRDSENFSESSLQQPKPVLEVASTSVPVASKQSAGTTATVSVENLASNTLSCASVAASDESVFVLTNTEGRRRETLSRSNSIKDHQKKPGKKGQAQPQHQVGGQSTSIASLPAQVLDQSTSSNSRASESIEAKITLAPSGTSEGVLESTSGTVGAATPGASKSKTDSAGEGSTCEPSEVSGAGNIVDTRDAVHHAKPDDFKLHDEQLKHETVGTGEQGKTKLPEGPKHDLSILEISSESISPKSSEVVKLTEEDSVLKVTTISNEVGSLETAHRELDEPRSCSTKTDKTSDNIVLSTSKMSDSINTETSPSNLISSTILYGDNAPTFDASSSISDSVGSKEAAVIKSGISAQDLAPVPTPCLSEATLKNEGEGEGEGEENISGVLVSPSVSGSKDKSTFEHNRAKSTMAKGKYRKKILQKADAAGTTSDLYMAYKSPEEKKETVILSESTESTSTSIDLKQVPADATQEDVVAGEKDAESKAEPDDWEDAADISTPTLETSDNGELGHGGLMHHDGAMTKTYSRDFLLKFVEQCTDLPEHFEITSDIAEALNVVNVNISHLVDRDSYPSPGRTVDRPSGGSRPDRRGSGMVDEDKWSKLTGPSASGRDLRLDIGYGGNVVGFRPGQGGNHGVLRNPRAQTPVHYPGGILPGLMQSMGSQGGMQRNSPDADRWQRATGFQKGLIPSPQTPLQVMHKAERKYEVGKVTDEEQAKQRQLKAILNKLTPQNFDKLFQQVKAVNIDNADTLSGVISQIFDKALMEPTFCEMYANFCFHLAGELPDFCEDNEKITFKRLLLNKCQEEFERGVREQEEANKVEEGEIKQSEEEREEKRTQARRRMLGNIRLIGELYKKKMLTERIMHECIKKLLGQYQNPDEEDVEALCKLMSTIGEMIDHPRAKDFMDAYFDRMATFSNNMKLSSRVRFMLKDAIDLRKNKWQQRRKVEGPKKIEEVHRDAAQERQAQVSRLARGPGSNSSMRRAPMDFGPRGSTMLSSPNPQMSGFRAMPAPARGYGNQDVRFEDRQPYEGRPLSVPLPHRPLGDDPITLGPQGGLARGMSIRGPASMPTLADIPSGPGDSRRMTAGLNGYSSGSERTTYSSREDPMQRYIPERFVSPSTYEQSSGQESNMPYGNKDLRNLDRSFDRSLATSPPTRVQGPSFTQNVPSEKVWPEERLRDMSILAIKEFYSAKDEKEVALCIKDLNSTSFYPAMISLWVTDSFERKDMERDLLGRLLVNLTKLQDGMLAQVHLLKGFEATLMTLEDAVNDAPKAAEFLGRIFAEVILENVIPLGDIGQLIYKGGEKPGRLVEIGLAADVLGSILEIIQQSDKGDSILNEFRSSSDLRLEDFRPPDPIKSRKLEKFI